MAAQFTATNSPLRPLALCTACASASLPLPDGVHLTGLTVHALDNGTNGVGLYLEAKELSNINTPLDLGDVSTTTQSATLTSPTAALDHTVDLGSYVYYLSACIPGEAGMPYRLYGATVTFDATPS